MVQATGRRGKGRSRILYWFRTPPGVRVGRGPLDEEAIRTIEAGNPDLEFDWTRILKGQAESGGEEPREDSLSLERRDSDRRDRRGGPKGRERRVEGPRESSVPRQRAAEGEGSIQGPPEPAAAEPTTAAHAKLGSEGLARLRARYCETLARIEERVVEPDRQEQLKALAERLNPDGWVTESDVSVGLESYEATFAELRSGIPSTRGSRSSVGTGPDRPLATDDQKDASGVSSESASDGEAGAPPTVRPGIIE